MPHHARFRIHILLAAIAASLLSLRSLRPGEDMTFLRGDSNSDGVLSIADGLYTWHYLFAGGMPPACLDAADLDDNGSLQFTDFGRTNFLLFDPAGWESGVKPPYPGAGADPTGDDLACEEYAPVPSPSTEDIIRMGDVAGGPGEVVEVPVFLTQEGQVEALELVVAYDPAVFAPEELDLAGVFPDAYGPSCQQARPFLVQLALRPEERLFTLGIIGDADTPFCDIPPGTNRLVARVRGRIAAGAHDGVETQLALIDGSSGGAGPHGMLTELAVPRDGNTRAVYPQGIPGTVRVVDPVFRRGDANDDARVDVSDAIYLLIFLALGGPPPSCHDAADSNDDGRLDMSDAIASLNYLFAAGAGVGPSFAECARDPTADAHPPCVYSHCSE